MRLIILRWRGVGTKDGSGLGCWTAAMSHPATTQQREANRFGRVAIERSERDLSARFRSQIGLFAVKAYRAQPLEPGSQVGVLAAELIGYQVDDERKTK